MKKKLFICLVLTMLFALALAPTACAEPVTVNDNDEFMAAVKDKYGKIEILVNNEIILTKDCNIVGDLSISGSGTIKLEVNTLHVYNKLTLNGDVKIVGPVRVSGDGALVLDGGSIELMDLYAELSGRPNAVTMHGGSLLMKSGSITGASTGASVLVDSTAEFTMKGGSITGSTGVGIKGKFTLEDGSITGGHNGVQVDGGSFLMKGGSVTGGNNGVNNRASFEMTGGSITGGSSAYGSGLENSGTAIINGGRIYNNTGTNQGADIYNAAGATLTLGKAAPGQTLSVCGHQVDGWYEDKADARWSCNEECVDVQPWTYTGEMYLIAAHKPIVPVSSVPATADDSNMPLWTGLLVAFAAAAVLTRKKKA